MSASSEKLNPPSRAVYETDFINKTPILFMMCGLPGAGKSTVANMLIHKGEKPIIHSSDGLREELYGNVNVQDHNEDIFIELHKRIKNDLKSGHNVVYDATNLSKKRRTAFLRELKNIDCKRCCILVLTPYEKCLRQNTQRDRIVPDEVILRMYKNFQPPSYSEGWDNIALIFNMDEEDLINKRWNTETLFEGDCGIDNFNQENSHHKYTLGMHCRKAQNYILMSASADFRLAFAALIRDEGKIITKSHLNSKGEDDGDCHYYQHHCCGAYDSFFYANNYNFSDKDMIYISNLIYYHMHAYNEWKQSERARKRFITKFGNEFYEDVMLLHEADCYAH